jgi:hypothetical protein
MMIVSEFISFHSTRYDTYTPCGIVHVSVSMDLGTNYVISNVRKDQS